MAFFISVADPVFFLFSSSADLICSLTLSGLESLPKKGGITANFIDISRIVLNEHIAIDLEHV